MEYKLIVQCKYVRLPIKTEQPEECLEILLGKEKIYEFLVPVEQTDGPSSYDYFSYINVEGFQGRTLTFRGNIPDRFFLDIIQTDDKAQEPLVRPMLHFSAERGWINDPNGLVCKDGLYHLFFQYNPVNTQWQNMSWGHAVSKDLLHFEQWDTALYPDENGAVFSGCGLVNERGLLGLPKDALLFYYSAAGDVNPWSKGKLYTQRIAYSLDEGRTLQKYPEAAVPEIQKDTRDPKVFWHEESGAYIMVLWIQSYEFGFFRSKDLKEWEPASRITLTGAWECPDLVRLEGPDGSRWVFLSADGFYYLGDFDGYTFHTDGIRKMAYLNPLPYAAQTYSGVEGRTISIPWLRTKNYGKLYSGLMGIPRELKLVSVRGEIRLQMLPVREYLKSRGVVLTQVLNGEKFIFHTEEEAVTEICLDFRKHGEAVLDVFSRRMVIRREAILYGSERTMLPEELWNVSVIIDRQVIEILGNDGTLCAYYETGNDIVQGKLSIEGLYGTAKVFRWRP